MRFFPLIFLFSCMTSPRSRPQEPAAKPAPTIDYASVVKEIAALKPRIAEIIEKGRLFEVKDEIRRMGAMAYDLPRFLDTDRIMAPINASARRLFEAADVHTQALVDAIAAELAILKKYEALSDEFEVQKVPAGCPKTYKAALSRIAGVQASVQEKLKADQPFEIAPAAKHLKLVAENLKRIAVNDIAYPLRRQVDEAVKRLRDAAAKVQAAADKEDAAAARKELDGLDEPLQALEKAGATAP